MTVLRKHILWLIIATLAGIVGAGLIYVARPTLYRSTALVDVEPNAAIAAQNVPNMATEQQVATSGVVLASTARALGVTASSLAADLSANAPGTANVLSIGCTMPTPAAAQRCAAAAAAAYVNIRNLAAGPRSQRARDLLHVTLVTPATLPTAPAGPGKQILLPIGALLGLALGTGAIFVRDYFDDRVRDRADLERCLEAPVVAAIPRVEPGSVDPAFVFCRAPVSGAAEAYRYLRSRLEPLISPAADGGTVLLVAGGQAGEGRTCVTANLAAALAQAGAVVTMVDADLRHPSLSEAFSAAGRPGLADLLAGTPLGEVAVPTEVPGLRLVPAGEAAGPAADLFELERLTGAFAELKAAGEVVVVDSAPVLAVSDAISLARVSDVAVMVADVRRTSRRAVTAAVQQIRAAGPRIVVGVLNGEAPSSERQARYGITRELTWMTPSRGVPAILAGIMPPGGRNGQRRAEPDAGPSGEQTPAGQA